jgi:hypothetical protein
LREAVLDAQSNGSIACVGHIREAVAVQRAAILAIVDEMWTARDEDLIIDAIKARECK